MTEPAPPQKGSRLLEFWNGLSPVLTALIALVALIVGGAGGAAVVHGTSSSSPQPTTVTQTTTVTVTRSTSATSSATTTSGASGPSPSEPVYWQGTVGITYDGVNFDISPPTTSSDAPTNISYTGTGLENSWLHTTIVVSWWNQPGKPSRSQCQSWVATHRNTQVDPVTPGMQICIKTALGRYGRLTIDPGANNDQLQATATIWGS